MAFVNLYAYALVNPIRFFSASFAGLSLVLRFIFSLLCSFRLLSSPQISRMAAPVVSIENNVANELYLIELQQPQQFQSENEI